MLKIPRDLLHIWFQMAKPTPNEAGWLSGMREDHKMNLHHRFQQSHVANSSMPTSNAAPSSTQKKKKTQPDQDAEVIALSPKTLTITSRFICDVCNKGFQREQNLQLHRRGHGLPWKLKLKSNTNEARKKVYVCPEPTCVHHHPSRALGDLTGIKKHFFRKHCEKKWECEKCSKRYAVQSDWKAHSKTCGTKEYRCDCGTLFSRRDSFVTHQAFCNAIAQGSVVNPINLSALNSQVFGPISTINGNDFGPLMPSAFHPINSAAAMGCSPKYHEEDQDKLAFNGMMQQKGQGTSENTDHQSFFYNTAREEEYESPTNDDFNSNISNHLSSSNLFASNQFCRNVVGGSLENAERSSTGLYFSENMMSDQVSKSLHTSAVSLHKSNALSSAHLSATALLQKAAQVGSSCSSSGSTSLLRTLGSSVMSSTKHDPHGSLGAMTSFTMLQNNEHVHDGWMSSHGGVGYITRSGEYATNGVMPMLSFEKPLVEHESSEEQQSQNLLNGSIISGGGGGGYDRLTRDFLGVGLIVRQMSGGFSQNDLLQHHQGHQMGPRTTMGGQ